MGRNDRHGRNNRRNWNNKNRNKQTDREEPKKTARPVLLHRETRQEAIEHEKAIKEFKTRQVVCEKCGLPINDIASALPDRETGNPVHFDCVLDELQKNEHVKENEKITYIGQGRFAVLHFDNIHDMKHFTIQKVIPWEDRDADCSWRKEMAALYSQIK
ncbi:MAG: hypothetical protein LKF96_05095 [Treponema sp.]|jgi:hypothetical protein|nr:hypothetical protein [Treponema sp.]